MSKVILLGSIFFLTTFIIAKLKKPESEMIRKYTVKTDLLEKKCEELQNQINCVENQNQVLQNQLGRVEDQNQVLQNQNQVLQSQVSRVEDQMNQILEYVQKSTKPAAENNQKSSANADRLKTVVTKQLRGEAVSEEEQAVITEAPFYKTAEKINNKAENVDFAEVEAADQVESTRNTNKILAQNHGEASFVELVSDFLNFYQETDSYFFA